MLIDNISIYPSRATFQINDSIIPPKFETEISVKFIPQNSNIGVNNIKITIGGNFDIRFDELHLIGKVSE